MTTNEPIILRLPAVSRRAWMIPTCGWLITSALVFTTIPARFGIDYRLTGATLVPGMIFGVWLLALWSINRYGSITITASTLRVGRDHVAIRDLDPAWLSKQAQVARPGGLDKIAASAGTNQIPGTKRPSAGPVLGGSWGASLGTDLLVLQRVNGTRFQIAARDIRVVLKGLQEAIKNAA